MSAVSSISPAASRDTPNQVQAPLRKRKPAANPLVKPKRQGQGRANGNRNGAGPSSKDGNKAAGAEPGAAAAAGHPTAVQPGEEFVDTPIFTTRHSLLKEHRHHIMRLFPNTNVERKDINPADPTQFTPPVKLHRRDPRSDPSLHWKEQASDGEASEDEKKPFNNRVDEKARAEAEIAKAERAAEREQNQAQIAPTIKSEAAKKKAPKQKKTQMVFEFTDADHKVKKQQIRYEESLPWHLEDFDNKNMWAGTYEAALSERHVMLLQEEDGKALRMVPLEKWYKFLPKSHFKTLSIDQAEAKMNTKHTTPRWFQRTVESDQKVKQENERNAMGKIYTRHGERGERPVKSLTRNAEYAADDEKPEQAQDADVIDYDYEEAFADDEENPILGGDDEENKEAEEKLKRERLEANIFDIKEEKDFDEEEEQEKRRVEEEKLKARKLTRALMKREKNFDYDDSDVGSTSEDDDAASTKENDQDEASKNGADKTSSSVSPSKETNTPRTDDSKKTNLKRPSSPGHSDQSGNESSRKKQKKTHASAVSAAASSSSSSAAAAAAAGAKISRPNSPGSDSGASSPRPGSTIKLNLTSSRKVGGDAAAGSGSEAEMSDGGVNGKKKNRKPISATPSRASSPALARPSGPGTANVPTNMQRTAKPPPVPHQGPIPTATEILSHVPKTGLHLNVLRDTYPKTLVKDPRFLAVLKSVTRFDSENKVFYPQPQPHAQTSTTPSAATGSS